MRLFLHARKCKENLTGKHCRRTPQRRRSCALLSDAGRQWNYRWCKRKAQRERDLPSAVMGFFVIALSLFPDVGHQSVLRWLLNGLQWLGNADFTVCVKSSLAAARKRLGPDPLRLITTILDPGVASAKELVAIYP